MTIAILGSGVRGRSDLTLGTVRVLRLSQAVFFFGSREITADWLTEHVGAPTAHDLVELYVDGAVDRENYERIVDHVMEQAARLGDVALLLPGHPLLGVTMTQMLCERGPQEGVEVTVADGVSSFDAMMTDLRRDPLTNSTLLVDANRLLLNAYEVDPRFDLLLYHVCSVGNARTHQQRPSVGNRLDLLATALSTSLGPTRPAALLHSGVTGRLDIPWEGQVADLAQIGSVVTFADTLFVPGSSDDSSTDSEFARVLALSAR